MSNWEILSIAQAFCTYFVCMCVSLGGDMQNNINSEVYARMDIRNARVMLYLATNPEKYINSRYPCALTKRKGFDGTPCLYRIATAFRQEGAFTLLEDLVTEKGLVPKPEEE